MQGNLYARCRTYGIDISVSYSGRNDVVKYINTKYHKEMAAVSSSSASITKFIQKYTSQISLKLKLAGLYLLHSTI